MRGIFTNIALGLASVVTSVAAVATPQWCQGTVSRLWIYSDGTVYVNSSYRGDYTRICNINSEIGGISSINCAAWFSILKSAVQRQSQVIVFYPEAVSCSTLPSYGSTPLPGYVMQVD